MARQDPIVRQYDSSNCPIVGIDRVWSLSHHGVCSKSGRDLPDRLFGSSILHQIDGELDCVSFCRIFDGPRGPKKRRHTAARPRGAIHQRGGVGSDDTHRSRRRPSRGTLPPVGRPSWVGVKMADQSTRGVPGGRPEILKGRGVEIPSVPAASEELAQKRLVYRSRSESVVQLPWHRGVAGRCRLSTPPQPRPQPLLRPLLQSNRPLRAVGSPSVGAGRAAAWPWRRRTACAALLDPRTLGCRQRRLQFYFQCVYLSERGTRARALPPRLWRAS